MLAFRWRFFAFMAGSGLLVSDSEPLKGRYLGGENPVFTARRLMETVCLAAFEAFCLHPRMVSLPDAFLERPRAAPTWCALNWD